jgi:UDP-N-acetyl-D-glucosamine dehydrogenase
MTPELALGILEQGDETVEPVAADLRLATDSEAQGCADSVVAVVGLGYVGLPTAVALRNAGARVIGIDASESRLTQIRDGQAELLDEEQADLQRHIQEEALVLTPSPDAMTLADMVLICVPTPIDEVRRPQPALLQGACASVVAHARSGQTIVLTSTTYVGCTRELLVEPLAERGLEAGKDVYVAFAPERIDPGVAEHEQLGTPRVVGGVSETCFRNAERLLRHTCKEVHRVTSPEAAELVKLYENSFRAVNIALAFEIGEACLTFGLDPVEVTDAAATKPYGFMPHYPSAGVGGHCIGVDPHYLAHPLRELGRPAPLIEQALAKVAGRPRHVVWRAHEELVSAGRSLRESRVLVVGASYKPGVADSREAPAREIIRRLGEEGAQVDYHDPLIPELDLGDATIASVDPDPRRDASSFGPEDYDLTIVVTVHPGHDYGWLRRCPTVLDCTYRTPAGGVRLVP